MTVRGGKPVPEAPLPPALIRRPCTNSPAPAFEVMTSKQPFRLVLGYPVVNYVGKQYKQKDLKEPAVEVL